MWSQSGNLYFIFQGVEALTWEIGSQWMAPLSCMGNYNHLKIIL